MSQETIGQRLRILINQLNLDVKGFCQRIDVSETTIRNYFSRGNNPNAEFLTKLTNTFDYVNLHWLLTGKGEPFLLDNASTTTNTAQIKNNSGIAINNGVATQNINLEDCKRELESMRRDAASYQREIELLTGQLQGKDALIAAKDETITLLRASYTRPN